MLERRRIRGDLIETFKILTGIEKVDMEQSLNSATLVQSQEPLQKVNSQQNADAVWTPESISLATEF